MRNSIKQAHQAAEQLAEALFSLECADEIVDFGHKMRTSGEALRPGSIAEQELKQAEALTATRAAVAAMRRELDILSGELLQRTR